MVVAAQAAPRSPPAGLCSEVSTLFHLLDILTLCLIVTNLLRASSLGSDPRSSQSNLRGIIQVYLHGLDMSCTKSAISVSQYPLHAYTSLGQTLPGHSRDDI